ncbi:hypothetical protein JCM14469_01100 [Desulfatiferula olefinivorans]
MENATYEISKKALELLHSQHIITLGTCDGSQPWVSPLYYVLNSGAFYFFSNPDSRHIVHGLGDDRVAASVHENSSGWSDIRGVQMIGTLSEAGFDMASTAAYAIYISRFSFIRDMGRAISPISTFAAIEASFKVKWYKYLPSRVYYLDNSIRFGYREEVDL